MAQHDEEPGLKCWWIFGVEFYIRDSGVLSLLRGTF